MHSIKQMDETHFEVTVQGSRQTRHIVTVAPAYAARFLGNGISVLDLVSRSFDFLLEREPNTSILSSFDLQVIACYFPEYETVIRDMLKDLRR